MMLRQAVLLRFDDLTHFAGRAQAVLRYRL